MTAQGSPFSPLFVVVSDMKRKSCLSKSGGVDLVNVVRHTGSAVCLSISERAPAECAHIRSFDKNFGVRCTLRRVHRM